MTAVYSAVPAAGLLEVFRRSDVVGLVAESARRVFRPLFEVEAGAVIGAARHERAERRVACRGGSRPKLLAAQAGGVQARVPKLRQGLFFLSVLEPGRRVGQVLRAVAMEAYVRGVSAWRVGGFAEALGASSGISKVGSVACLRRVG
jgi:transposase-like protein